MLQLSKTLQNVPVMSLRTGGQVATALRPIIDPNNLKIVGWHCQDSLQKKHPLILLSQDIRDIIKQGLVINDHDVLAEPEDLIRLKDLLKLNFELLGKPVYSDSKRHLGKVNDYAVEGESLYVQKLYLSQSLMKSFSGGGLSVDRNQILEITSRKIVINEPLQPTKASAASVPVG
jgi:sporulation protein YlmC with PRC-barrel domain